MATREEIREGIAELAFDCRHSDNEILDRYGWADCFLKYLHSQGCVIKVDRELPLIKSKGYQYKRECEIAIEQVEIMKQAGYVATESLVEK